MLFNDIQDSINDERDHIWDNICGISVNEIPDEWIAPYYTVYDQKNSMWCMSFASTGLWEIIENMISNGQTKMNFSKEFMMYNAKQLDGIPHTQGTTGKAIMDSALKFGFCPENLCPTTFKGELRGEIVKPSQSAFNEALQHKPEAYARVLDLKGILTAIYQCGGVYTSLLYYRDMLRPENGYIGEPSVNSIKMGGHSTAWIGYHKTKTMTVKGKTYTGFFIQLNSYGEKQGIFGIEIIPFDILNWFGGKYKYSIDKIFREAWCFYRKKDVIENKFFIDNQPKQVIKDVKSIDMTFTMNSNIAIVDGKTIKMDVAPKCINGTNFVPFRFIFETMDCDVSYTKREDGHDAIRGIDKNTGVTVDLNLGWQVGYVRGQEYFMPQAPFAENGRTYVGLRAVSEMLGCKVVYDNITKQITIKR